MQLTYLVASLLLTASSVIAQPPACLLAPLGQQSNPGDIKGICQSKASDVQRSIQSACGGDAATALTAFADTCKGAGVTVPAVKASASGTTNGTSSSSTNGTSGSSSGSKNGGGQLTSGLLSVAIAGLVGGATFVL